MADVIGPVPLLNHYKYDLLRRRMLAVITGGLNIRRAPWLLHFIQIVLWVSPFLLSVPFVVVDALKLWNQYYIALVYAIVMVLFSLTLELCVVVWRHCKGAIYSVLLTIVTCYIQVAYLLAHSMEMNKTMLSNLTRYWIELHWTFYSVANESRL